MHWIFGAIKYVFKIHFCIVIFLNCHHYMQRQNKCPGYRPGLQVDFRFFVCGRRLHSDVFAHIQQLSNVILGKVSITVYAVLPGASMVRHVPGFTVHPGGWGSPLRVFIIIIKSIRRTFPDYRFLCVLQFLILVLDIVQRVLLFSVIFE